MLVAVALFVTVAWTAREIQAMRERVFTERLVADMRSAHHSTRQSMRRIAEDLFVTQQLLAERNILPQAELLRGRARLIEAPRRRAKEKHSMAQHVRPQQAHLIIEDRDGNVH